MVTFEKNYSAQIEELEKMKVHFEGNVLRAGTNIEESFRWQRAYFSICSAIWSLKKQIPINPEMFHCDCGMALGSAMWNYCPVCGQAFEIK